MVGVQDFGPTADMSEGDSMQIDHAAAGTNDQAPSSTATIDPAPTTGDNHQELSSEEVDQVDDDNIQDEMTGNEILIVYDLQYLSSEDVDDDNVQDEMTGMKY